MRSALFLQPLSYYLLFRADNIRPYVPNSFCTLHSPWLLSDKTEACVLEIWTEALGMLDKPTSRQSRELGLILDNINGWEKVEGFKWFGVYKSQRFWQRIQDADFKRINDDYVEIVEK